MDARRILRDDTGAAAVVVAVFFIAALLMAAVVVDVGYLYAARRQLQSAADAGALAGCQELIQTEDPGAATALAREYAQRNAVGPAVGLAVDGVVVNTAECSVRVAVSRQTPVFFARILGPASRRVVATAKARKWQLSGGRYLVPWAIPIIRHVERIEAWVDGGSPVVLSEVSGLHWSGAVAAPGAGDSRDMFVRVYNDYGVPELLVESSGPGMLDAPVARVSGYSATGGLASVRLSDDFLSSNGSGRYFPITLTVRTVEPQPELTAVIDRAAYPMSTSDGGTLWTLTISAGMVSLTDDPFTVVPVYVKAGAGGGAALPTAYIHVRRTTAPIDRVIVSPLVQDPGGAVGVDVHLNDFDPSIAQPGTLYTLRVNATGNIGGNFGELNLGSIQHSGDCPPDPAGIRISTNYFQNVAYGYKGGVHVGDIINMSPGESGSNTDRALDDRTSRLLPGDDLVVCVPVVEKYEDKGNGTYEVIVVAFASFRVLEHGDGDVEAEFIEYVANPAEFTPTPGGGDPVGGISAARLVNP